MSAWLAPSPWPSREQHQPACFYRPLLGPPRPQDPSRNIIVPTATLVAFRKSRLEDVISTSLFDIQVGRIVCRNESASHSPNRDRAQTSRFSGGLRQTNSRRKPQAAKHGLRCSFHRLALAWQHGNSPQCGKEDFSPLNPAVQLSDGEWRTADSSTSVLSRNLPRKSACRRKETGKH
jgi:hypothetical protein